MDMTKSFLEKFAHTNVRYYAYKRFIDVTFAACGVILGLPLLGIIALTIIIDSSGPVFFKQKRYGQNRKSFYIYKFRTMHTKTCHVTGGAQATKNDPRVTRFGRFLRKSSLDELPQLINILIGDMSVVGPRAHAADMNDYYADLIPFYDRRHDVKPGLTGWAQIHGLRGETRKLEQMRQRALYDLDYIRRQSLWLDIKIIFLTVYVVLTSQNAY